jgi:catechol 2,3-dioxygenase-like lactoylglutathione lyase family enzyme
MLPRMLWTQRRLSPCKRQRSGDSKPQAAGRLEAHLAQIATSDEIVGAPQDAKGLRHPARLTELGAELEATEGGNDPARPTRARAELARAVGLGGRDGRAASHAERARLNATRAIRATMANLARANPSLGRHLAATIRTGRYCAYTPASRSPGSADPSIGLHRAARAPCSRLTEQRCRDVERPRAKHPVHCREGRSRRGRSSQLEDRTTKEGGRMRIGLTSIFVDDQDQAERFYTETLGLQVKTNAPYSDTERWLSVVAPEDPDGVELVLHLTDEPARAFQAANLELGRPVLSLRTDDCLGEAERLKAKGGVHQGTSRMAYGGMDAVFADSCGNLLNLHQD